MLPERVGKRIAYFRKQNGYAQAALADHLHVTPQAVSKWERGLALPELPILLEMARLFGVSMHALVDDQEMKGSSSPGRLPPAVQQLGLDAAHKRLLKSLARFFAPEEIVQLARSFADGSAELSVTLQMDAGRGTAQVRLPAESLTETALAELAPHLAQTVSATFPFVDPGLRALLPVLRCPACGGAFSFTQRDETTGLACQAGHHFPIVDGVVDFGVREIKGEFWSLHLRNYEQYCQLRSPGAINPNFLRGKPLDEAMWREIERAKPGIMLDIATGMGSALASYVPRISWPCVLVMADISHRILKYNRQWFSSHRSNPNVQYVYLACDCTNLPFVPGSVDTVTSLAGFESMQDGFEKGFAQAFAALRKGGCSIHTRAVVKGDANTQQWLDSMTASQDADVRNMAHRMLDALPTLDAWPAYCGKFGYTQTEIDVLYDELPAPNDGRFPFRNDLIQWMGMAVCASHK